MQSANTSRRRPLRRLRRMGAPPCRTTSLTTNSHINMRINQPRACTPTSTSTITPTLIRNRNRSHTHIHTHTGPRARTSPCARTRATCHSVAGRGVCFSSVRLLTRVLSIYVFFPHWSWYAPGVAFIRLDALRVVVTVTYAIAQACDPSTNTGSHSECISARICGRSSSGDQDGRCCGCHRSKT